MKLIIAMIYMLISLMLFGSSVRIYGSTSSDYLDTNGWQFTLYSYSIDVMRVPGETVRHIVGE